MRILFVALLATVALALSTPEWHRVRRADMSDIHTARFALVQRNQDILAAKTMDIADPASPNYGKWMTIDEINDIVAPDMEVVAEFLEWIREKDGFTILEVRPDVILFQATVAALTEVFQADMHYYTEFATGKTILRGDYAIPSEWRHIVEFIPGMTELPRTRRTKTAKNFGNDVSAGYVIPEFIRKLYNIDSAHSKTLSKNSSLCLAEFQDDSSFSKADLLNFAKQSGETAFQVAKEHIIGPYSPDSPDGESTLDVQYGGAIAGGSTVWFWTVADWMLEFSQDLFKRDPAPYVVSMSWGWPENQQCQITSCGGMTSEGYVNRVNTEWNKITARGITLVASSGDQGAPGDSNSDCDNSATPLSNIFPGASPWVLSVGATMLTPTGAQAVMAGAPVCNDKKCASLPATEEVCTYPGALITSGGGFSSYSSRPTYQLSAALKYLNSGVALPPSQYYNSTTRGFPDVSALGHAYLIYYEGEMLQVDGTSCSAPVWGGMIALLNGYRLNAGKTPLGFVNPMIYTMAAKEPDTFTDIKSGNNKCTEDCCATYGFEAAAGWDPVTGLGTPNYGNIYSYVKTLP